MKVIRGIHAIPKIQTGSVVTVGVFDGVHIGHRKVIREVVRLARLRKRTSVVVTFDPHPAKLLRPSSAVPSIISLKHRIRLIRELGVDMLVIARFTGAFSRIAPSAFIRTVVAGRLNAREIAVSGKFYFGKGARAGVRELKKIAAACGVRVRIVRPAKALGAVVGSSLVRSLILKGDIRRAARLIGRPVSVLGTVVSGSRFGRVLGYPTANINPHHEVVPPSGVYAVIVQVGGRRYGGLLNRGTRPTFFSPRDSEPQIEAHIFDFAGTIYGRDIEVHFIRKIREEVRFNDRQELVAQIRRDEKAARFILKGEKALQ